MKSQSSEHDSKLVERSLLQHGVKNVTLEDYLSSKLRRNSSSYHKNSINFKTISSVIKDYKLEGPEVGTLFFGYSKEILILLLSNMQRKVWGQSLRYMIGFGRI